MFDRLELVGDVRVRDDVALGLRPVYVSYFLEGIGGSLLHLSLLARGLVRILRPQVIKLLSEEIVQ